MHDKEYDAEMPQGGGHTPDVDPVIAGRAGGGRI